MNKYIHVKSIDQESKKIYPLEALWEATFGSKTDRSLLIKQFPNGLMLSLFTLQSPQLQKLQSSNLKRDLSTLGGDTGCFSWWGIVCWGWMTNTYTTFPALPPIFETALPPSHQDMHFRHFQAPASKPFQDRSKACWMLSLSLWLLHIGNRQFQNTQQLSVQVSWLNWTTSMTTFKQNYWDLSNSYEQRKLPQGEATASKVVLMRAVWPCLLFHTEYVILADKQALRRWKTSLELWDDSSKFMRQFWFEPLSFFTHLSSLQDSISIISY